MTQMLIGTNFKAVKHVYQTKYHCNFCGTNIKSKSLKNHDFTQTLILCAKCNREYTLNILDINPTHLFKYVNKEDI